jgi:hypothetical protein
VPELKAPPARSFVPDPDYRAKPASFLMRQAAGRELPARLIGLPAARLRLPGMRAGMLFGHRNQPRSGTRHICHAVSFALQSSRSNGKTSSPAAPDQTTSDTNALEHWYWEMLAPIIQPWDRTSRAGVGLSGKSMMNLAFRPEATRKR